MATLDIQLLVRVSTPDESQLYLDLPAGTPVRNVAQSIHPDGDPSAELEYQDPQTGTWRRAVSLGGQVRIDPASL